MKDYERVEAWDVKFGMLIRTGPKAKHDQSRTRVLKSIGCRNHRVNKHEKEEIHTDPGNGSD